MPHAPGLSHVPPSHNALAVGIPNNPNFMGECSAGDYFSKLQVDSPDAARNAPDLQAHIKRKQGRAIPGSLLLTDVDLDGELLLVIPRDVVVEELNASSCLRNARTFGDVRKNASAWATVAGHLPTYRASLASRGEDDCEAADDDSFDIETFFAQDSSAWTPIARHLTYEFLITCAAEVAERYCRADEGWGFAYRPAPWVHVDERDSLEADLAARAYEIGRWRGLAELFLTPPSNATALLELP